MGQSKYHLQIQELERYLNKSFGELGLGSSAKIYPVDLRQGSFWVGYKEGNLEAKESIMQILGKVYMNRPEVRLREEYDSVSGFEKTYLTINKDETPDYEAAKRHEVLCDMKHEIENIFLQGRRKYESKRTSV